MDSKLILVVEDDPILKNLLSHTFSGKYQTIYANDGAEALKLFEEHKPALVMLDLVMAGVDGFSVLEQIRARSDDYRKVPVIVVSNLSSEADIERAKTLGATDYLVKAENSIDEIIAKIGEVLLKT